MVKKKETPSPMRLIFLIFGGLMVFILGGAILTVVLGAAEGFSESGITFNFFISELENVTDKDVETFQRLDGTVYLNDVRLGDTEEGVLVIERDTLTPGAFRFETGYYGRSIRYTDTLTEEHLNEGILDVILNKTEFESFTLVFFVNQTAERLDGNVYIMQDYLGKSAGGTLTVPLELLYPGVITLNSTYNNKEFTSLFEFTQEDLGKFKKEFVVDKKEIEDTFFDTSALDASIIEQAVFEQSNSERASLGLKSLRLDNKLSAIAREYSGQVVEGGFHHTDPEGKSVSDRLLENQIFYTVVGENLYASESLDSVTTGQDVARYTVQGWLESPDHRAMLLITEELYSDMGVGAYCVGDRCYVTQIFAGLEITFKKSFSASSCEAYWIYHEDLDLNFNVTVRIRVTADEKLGVYVIDDLDMRERCLQHDDIYNNLVGYKRIDDFDETILAKPGHSLLFEVGNPSNVEVSIDYRGSFVV